MSIGTIWYHAGPEGFVFECGHQFRADDSTIGQHFPRDHTAAASSRGEALFGVRLVQYRCFPASVLNGGCHQAVLHVHLRFGLRRCDFHTIYEVLSLISSVYNGGKVPSLGEGAKRVSIGVEITWGLMILYTTGITRVCASNLLRQLANVCNSAIFLFVLTYMFFEEPCVVSPDRVRISTLNITLGVRTSTSKEQRLGVHHKGELVVVVFANDGVFTVFGYRIDVGFLLANT